jgi:transposase
MTREQFDRVMQLHCEGLSIRAINRRTGLDREALSAALKAGRPQKRRPTRSGSILDGYQGFIMGKLQQYPELSAARLHIMLKDQNFKGSYSLVKQAVAELRPRLQTVYESLHFAPGDCAQVDWGVWKNFKVTNGQRRLSIFVMVLCDSRLTYAEMFPGETLEYWLAGHRRAFEYFGGVPRRIMVDNCKTAVLTPKGWGREAALNASYAAFAKHYGFHIEPCTPHRPNEKGRVERAVGYLKEAFLAGREPAAPEVLNPALRDFLAITANARKHGTTGKRPIDAFTESEKAALQPLPGEPHPCADITSCVANSCCRVTVDVNRYSVPPAYASQRLILHRHADRIIIRTADKGELVADHPRHFGRNQEIVDPDHSQALRELNGHARENREIGELLAMGTVAQDFLIGLKDKRTNYRRHVRQINALAKVNGRDVVAAALQAAHDMHVYSADAVINLVDAKARVREQTAAPLQLIRNAELLDMPTPHTDLEQYDRRNNP